MTTSKVAITEGSGKYAATYSFTEDAVTKEAQRLVLARSDGSEIVISGGGALVTVTPTVTASTYAVSVCMGGKMTFASILAPVNFGGILENLVLKFKGSVQTVGFWVSIFNTSPSGTFTDHSASSIVAGDTALLLGSYHLTTPFSLLGTHTIYNLDGISAQIIGLSTSLFAVVVPDATTASLGSTSDMTLGIGIAW